MKELLKYLKPLKRKVIFEKLINYIIISLSAGLAISSAVVIMSKFVFIDDLLQKLIAIMVLSLLTAFIMTAAKIPDKYKIAEIGDSLGFKERFITAHAIFEENKEKSPIGALVVEDAVNKAKEADFNKLYKIKVSNKKFMALFLAAVILAVSGFIPASKAEEIEKHRQVQKIVDEQIEVIKEKEKEIQELELLKEIKELKKELKKAKTTNEAIETIQKAQQKLKKLENKAELKDLKELGESLSKNAASSSLGESLKQGDKQKIAEELEKLKEQFEKMTQEEKEEFLKKMEETAKKLSQNNNSLSEEVNQLSQAL